MRKFVLFGAFLIGACSAGTPPVSEDTMAAVLADLHLAESRAQMIPADSNSIPTGLGRNLDSLAVFYQSVLNHYDLDTTTFRAALSWYTAHPAALDSAYKKAIVRLEGLSGEAVPPQ